MGAILKHGGWLASLLRILVVVQITEVRVKLLVRTHTMSDVLICLLLRSVVGVFGKDFLWGHLKLLKEKLRRSFRDLIIT